MIIGHGKSGKTTLAAYLEGKESLRPVPSIIYRSNTLDTPGSYLESPWMHNHLIAAAQDASCIVMMADAAGTRKIYPPNFAKAFRVPVIGVVSRCDLPAANPFFAEQELIQAGVKPPIYKITTKDDQSIKRLLEVLSPWIPQSEGTGGTTKS